MTTEGDDVSSNAGFGITPRETLLGPYTAGCGALLMIFGGLRAFLPGAQALRHWVLPILSMIASGAVLLLAYLTLDSLSTWTSIDSYTDPPVVHDPGLGLWITLGLGGAALLVSLLALFKRS